ncbi:Uncharacterized protein YuzB, UPF0349 family [Seinonella peptonophila]|uniref:Uncharacterized protein YuzB, UPF0349 family n=1 Tax=Seinonella peptonophila TaxID=112248 RepID=A0A1M4WKD3_9BACL|nr:YuzB family protein [Seinonella peptonophila]SHE81442.1 Uncharacterized protein YuzB, UPF0349 family [Seinonella peptonophila]
MRPLIEFCVNNLTDDVLALMKELEQNIDLDVIEYGCLGNCGICAEFPYALVNGDVVTGKDVDELRKNIYRAIEEMEVRF